jgi:transposase InsO family protein
MPRAKRRYTGAGVAGPFRYDYARPITARWLDDAPSLSKKGKLRLSWIEYWTAHGNNVSLTCRHFGIARTTLMRWLARYDRYDLTTLEDRSTAPRSRRTPTIALSTVDLVLQIRDERPAWSKYKLSVVLERDFGVGVSASSVGRILTRHGRIEAKASARRKRAAVGRNKRMRRPKDLTPTAPGELVQVDTKHLNLPWSKKRYHFEAIDLATRMKVSGVANTASSKSAAAFLVEALERFPFHVKAIQTDNGSEFAHLFERACVDAGIPHYLSYPRCPKQNAWVERVIRTAQDELYLYHDTPVSIAEHAELLAWFDRDYNEVRPHQSLGYLTPAEYYARQTRSQECTP